jgi:hypothetical protein
LSAHAPGTRSRTCPWPRPPTLMARWGAAPGRPASGRQCAQCGAISVPAGGTPRTDAAARRPPPADSGPFGSLGTGAPRPATRAERDPAAAARSGAAPAPASPRPRGGGRSLCGHDYLFWPDGSAYRPRRAIEAAIPFMEWHALLARHSRRAKKRPLHYWHALSEDARPPAGTRSRPRHVARRAGPGRLRGSGFRAGSGPGTAGQGA